MRGAGIAGAAVYRAADPDGNFAASADEDGGELGPRHIDFDELEHDPSERRPGGPVAEAVHASTVQVYRAKWLFPVIVFVLASLVQSAGMLAATHRYVHWWDKVERQYKGLEAHEAFQAETRRWRLHHIHERLSPSDNFAQWLGAPSDVSKGPIGLLAWAIPPCWAVICIMSRNIRLWARTFLVATLLALLKGLFVWATVVPDSSGWAACRERLNAQALGYFEAEESGFVGTLRGVPFVLWLWIQNLLFGMRQDQDLVCSNSFSGPSYLAAVFSMGLYDALRTKSRKLKPMFKVLSHWGCGLVLTLIVVADAMLDIVHRRQYTADVVLALVFSLLLYCNPAVAMAIDNFLLRGAPRRLHCKDGCDLGDVLVPPCCVPFCLLHGRYFLFDKSAEDVENARQAQLQAARVAERFRLEQEEATRKLLELEAELESVRQRTKVRERQEAVEAERRYHDTMTEMQTAHDARVSRKLAEIEAEVQCEREPVKPLEERVDTQRRRLEQWTRQAEDQEGTLQIELAMLRQDVEHSNTVAHDCRDCEEAELASLAELRRQLADLQAAGAVLTEAEAATLAGFAAPPEAGHPTDTRESSFGVLQHGGDFRSAPPECWAAIHARFHQASGTGAAPVLEDATVAVTKVPLGPGKVVEPAATEPEEKEPLKQPVADGPLILTRPYRWLPSVGPKLYLERAPS